MFEANRPYRHDRNDSGLISFVAHIPWDGVCVCFFARSLRCAFRSVIMSLLRVTLLGLATQINTRFFSAAAAEASAADDTATAQQSSTCSAYLADLVGWLRREMRAEVHVSDCAHSMFEDFSIMYAGK